MYPNNQKKKNLQREQLLQLHDMRVKSCEIRYREAQEKQYQAQQDVDERKAGIKKLKEQKYKLNDYIASDRVIAAPSLMKAADTRRFWINYDLEKDEYYLSMDEDALEEAKKHCLKLKSDWLQARSREQGARSLLEKSQREMLRIHEIKQELDNEEILIGKEYL